MPKKIITEDTIPLVLEELDKWSDKLTWNLFAEHLASVLGEKSISRYTLLSYPQIVESFKDRKKDLKGVNKNKIKTNDSQNCSQNKIDMLESKVRRLEKENTCLKEQFIRWQYNLYMMPDVDMENLNSKLDRPLVEVSRR